MEFEIKVPEKAFPQNKEGKDCECMNREYLLTYKKGRLHWLCAPGERVAKGQLICEAEIEKRIFEVLSPADGVLSEQRVAEGERFAGEYVLGVVTADG
jgi:biotin carboxyl carrier protein